MSDAHSSHRQGVGTPRASRAPSATTARPRPEEQEQPLRARVLLAEDDPDIQLLLQKVLRKMNLEVEIVENGGLACEAAADSEAEGRPYDLILMDMQLPHIDGYEATRWLRWQGWRGSIVALTAHTLVGDRVKCLEAGCDDYIAKPIDAQALPNLLARHLSRRAGAGDGRQSGRPTTTSCVEGNVPSSPAPPRERGTEESPVLGEMDRLRDAFVGRLPERARAVEAAWNARDLEALGRLAHQLKGTAGVYGFVPLARAAGAVEERATAQCAPQELQAGVTGLLDLCRQAAAADRGSLPGAAPHPRERP